jgi:hypothetical protein
MDDKVIVWGFYGYRTPAGGREVQDWFDNLPDSTKDEMRDVLGYLQVQPRHLWTLPGFEAFDSELSEVRFKDALKNKWYRIYGMFSGPEDRRYSYIFLLGKDKKTGNDKRGKEEARRRLKMIKRREATFHDFKFG